MFGRYQNRRILYATNCKNAIVMDTTKQFLGPNKHLSLYSYNPCTRAITIAHPDQLNYTFKIPT